MFCLAYGTFVCTCVELLEPKQTFADIHFDTLTYSCATSSGLIRASTVTSRLVYSCHRQAGHCISSNTSLTQAVRRLQHTIGIVMQPDVPNLAGNIDTMLPILHNHRMQKGCPYQSCHCLSLCTLQLPCQKGQLLQPHSAFPTQRSLCRCRGSGRVHRD